VRIDVRQAALVAAFAAAASGVAATTATAARSPAAKAPAPTVRGVAGPKAAVASGAKVTVRAQARNAARRAAKVTIAFHLSADRRWDRGDVKLGSATTRRLKPGRSGAVALTAKLPAKATAGSWTLLACSGPARRPACAAAARKLVVKAPARPAPPTPPAPAPPAPGPAPGPSGPPIDSGPAPLPPALALQLADGIEWGRLGGAGPELEEGDELTTAIRLGEGLPGQAGYERANVSPAGPLTGTETPITGASDTGDDVSYPFELPFAFPFAGVPTRTVSVSSNGWISFDGTALAYTDSWVEDDYRGDSPATVGAHLPAIMPFFSDLEVATGDRIDAVTAADGQSVAIRWRVRTLGNAVPVDFQAVLFADGRIRFDYLSSDPLGDDDPLTPLDTPGNARIGFSPGVAGRVAEYDRAERTALPAESVLLTPKSTAPATQAPAGTVAVEIPRGADYASGSAGCELTTAATVLAPGVVTCPTPALLDAGTTVEVRWTLPTGLAWALVGNRFDQAATWSAGGATAAGAGELGSWARLETASALDVSTVWESGQPRVTVEAQNTNDILRRPRLTAELPAGSAVAGARIGSTPADLATLAQICTGLPVPAAGGTVSCLLPSGIDTSTPVTVALTLADPGSGPTIPFTLAADNLPDGPLRATETLTPPPG
jgi:hypothetical protein